jgi:hypothetical protein
LLTGSRSKRAPFRRTFRQSLAAVSSLEVMVPVPYGKPQYNKDASPSARQQGQITSSFVTTQNLPPIDLKSSHKPRQWHQHQLLQLQRMFLVNLKFIRMQHERAIVVSPLFCVRECWVPCVTGQSRWAGLGRRTQHQQRVSVKRRRGRAREGVSRETLSICWTLDKSLIHKLLKKRHSIINY